MPIVNNDQDLNRYNDFVRNSEYARPMQDTNWSKIKNNWTHDYVYLEENKQIIAAMSVIGIKNTNGKHFLYAPRGPVCDFKDTKLVEALIKEAEPLKDKYDAFLLRMDPEINFDEKLLYDYRKMGYDFRSLGIDTHAFTQPRYNMIIDLSSQDEDEIFESFSPKGRYNVRKSIRAGIKTICKTDEESLDIFYELTKIMAERQGIGHRPKDYYERLIEYLGGEIFVSYFEDKALSASLLIPYGKKVYYLYAASSNEMRNKMPNYNMIWEEIQWCLENGYDYLDLGGTFSLDTNDGLYRFKQSFCYPDKYSNFIGELDVVYDREKYEEFLITK
ncbi:lipid II:glycine glycyltransferase FemX [Anaerococcus degeneri]|uniref:Aminoacyltransferase n=1 Tax=Anaerococcus degeneri TaxID=361500 RepID=A0ABS7Z3I3_9FIRM|nr:peptidoglycan bridge formation glycyltransferase FemA/FemB family protein [Anaerococcus degeneri]MBP2014887.1 lipid II:glycine glycyltransferase (peptidoglycan interpeptide bridge formation enzyme) [Anaerococcus degeneri]MCA2097096.1 aminoacyltransferase [Anaerococcus degeneri]